MSLSKEEKAYMAGFLDGDGSIMVQSVLRKGYRFGYQIRVSIVFFQKTQHRDFLLELKERLGCGYVRIRNDGMSEYTIVGLKEAEFVLKLLYPFLRLKKALAKEVLDIINQHPLQREMTAQKLVVLSRLADKASLFNYSKKRTHTSAKVIAFLREQGLYVPVETDCQGSSLA